MTAKEKLVETIRTMINSKDFNPDELYSVMQDYERFLKYNPALVFQTACDANQISVSTATPKKKLQKVNERASMSRFLFYKYMREASGNKVSLDRMGAYLERDHASVLYGIKRLNSLLEVKDEKATLAYQKFTTLMEVRKHLI